MCSNATAVPCGGVSLPVGLCIVEPFIVFHIDRVSHPNCVYIHVQVIPSLRIVKTGRTEAAFHSCLNGIFRKSKFGCVWLQTLHNQTHRFAVRKKPKPFVVARAGFSERRRSQQRKCEQSRHDKKTQLHNPFLLRPIPRQPPVREEAHLLFRVGGCAHRRATHSHGHNCEDRNTPDARIPEVVVPDAPGPALERAAGIPGVSCHRLDRRPSIGQGLGECG